MSDVSWEVDVRQHLQDWLSQQWVMLTGRRVDADAHGWLLGPLGEVGVIADRFVATVAERERLVVERHRRTAGLVDSLDRLDLAAADRERLCPEIAAFYERTADHELEAWFEWRAAFRPFAGLIQHLYSRRLQQLNLPLRPLDTSRGIDSEIVKLRDAATGEARHTVWYRVLRASGRVIYSGIYSAAPLPNGETAVKVSFPLPRGAATVLMAVRVGDAGELVLTSAGRRFGDAGFYFVLRDAKGRHWARYVRSLRERITVFVDDNGTLRADHVLELWGLRALTLHYRIRRLPAETLTTARES